MLIAFVRGKPDASRDYRNGLNGSASGLLTLRYSRTFLFLSLLLSASSNEKQESALSITHPANSSSEVEYFLRGPDGNGPWPTVVLLHGYQPPWRRSGGRIFLDNGILEHYARKGYLAVAISPPGYGGSDGSMDFAGLYTQQAVRAVITRLVAEGKAEKGKILLFGTSLGAVTAGLVAANDQRVTGLILISGLYDLPAFFEHPKSLGARQVKVSFAMQTGGGKEALRLRSVMPVAKRIKAPTLLLNGAQDDRTDPNQAQLVAKAIEAHGGRARAVVFPELGHQIKGADASSEIETFIDATLRPPPEDNE